MDLIDNCKDFLRRFLGQDICIAPLPANSAKALPLAVSVNYNFFETDLYGQPLALLHPKNSETLTPGQIEKHKNIVASQLHKMVVMLFDTLASYNMSRLMGRNINFIVPDKQVFMPDILINLRQEPAMRNEIKVIPPIAQVILLWQLQRGGLEGLDTRTIATHIGSTPSTTYRSMNWLEKNDMVQMVGEKEKRIRFCSHGKEFWDAASQLCISPIERVVYTDDTISGLKTNIEALAEKTMMNSDGKHHIALTKAQLKASHALVDARYGDTRVEVWRYDPRMLAEGDCVDPLSLYLAMRDIDDDRIQTELEHMIATLW